MPVATGWNNRKTWIGWPTLMDDGETVTTTRELTRIAQSLKNIYLASFRPLYLIFDQFEELFILGSAAEQEQFIETVKEMLTAEQPVKMIFSIREEYLGHLNRFERAVPQLLRKKLRVEPMNLDKVRQVILGATNHKNTNVRLANGEKDTIAEGIFDKIKGAEKTLTIPLPYLQVFLDKLYLQVTNNDETRQAEAIFTLQALGEMGDIGDVLRNFLEEQVAGITKKLSTTYSNISIETTWTILSPFATLEGTKEPIGKQGLYDRLPDLNKPLIDAAVEAFINSRILRYTEEADLYEIAHDSLAKRIAEKRSDEDIALLEIKRLIKTQTSLKAGARGTISEEQLTFIEPFLNKIKLTAEEHALIQQSKQAVALQKAATLRQQTLEKNQQTQKRFIRWIGTALVMMVGLAIWAFYQKQQASHNFDIAKAEKQRADSALALASKLVNTIYFYDGKFALSIKEVDDRQQYGFVNKNGDVVIDYKYDQAEQFDNYTGFARVKRKNDEDVLISFLVDTTGKEYPFASTIADVKESVTAVDLSNQHLNSIPEAILHNPQIQILFLNGNNINQLPSGFGHLTALKYLDLRSNGLTTLPAEIGQLKALQSLDLSGNRLTTLPAEIVHLTALQSLDLSGNGLTTLPAEIVQLKALQSLYLSDNELTSPACGNRTAKSFAISVSEQ